MNSKTVLVVDDEEKIVEVVESYLENEGYNVTPDQEVFIDSSLNLHFPAI